jgi:short-subunit dehydrogenase
LRFVIDLNSFRIVNLSSIAGFLSAPTMGFYDASKHAVEGFAKALRAEMKPWNIHVSNLNPGFMRFLSCSANHHFLTSLELQLSLVDENELSLSSTRAHYEMNTTIKLKIMKQS